MEGIDWATLLPSLAILIGAIGGAIVTVNRLVNNALEKSKLADKAEQQSLDELKNRIAKLETLVTQYEAERLEWATERERMSVESARQKQALAALETRRNREAKEWADERSAMEERIVWLTTQLEAVNDTLEQKSAEIAALRTELEKARVDKAVLKVQTEAYADVLERLDKWLQPLVKNLSAT